MREKLLWGALAVCAAVCLVVLFGHKQQEQSGLAAVLAPAPEAPMAAAAVPALTPFEFSDSGSNAALPPLETLGIGDRQRVTVPRERPPVDEQQETLRKTKEEEKRSSGSSSGSHTGSSGAVDSDDPEVGITKADRPTEQEMQEMEEKGIIIF